MFEHNPDPARKIGALCSLFVIGGSDTPFLRRLLRYKHESVRAWAIRFLTDNLPIDTIYSRRGGPDVVLPADLLRQLAEIATADPSGLVRLVLASTLQRLPLGQRESLADARLSRSEDGADHNLPSLIWTGLIPVADADPDVLVRLALDCRLAEVQRLIARRLGEEIETNPGPVNALLEAGEQQPEGSVLRTQLVAGLTDAMTGWRKAKKPAAWDRFQEKLSKGPDPALQARVRRSQRAFRRWPRP